MAVEARQFLQDREILMNEGHAYSLQAIPFPGNHLFYHQQPKTSINTHSTLTCNIPTSRKRSRDSADIQKSKAGSQLFGENILPQIQQYQSEIDAIICEHTKKIRLELQERQKQQAKVLVAGIGESMMKTLREKDDQIQKMAKLNLMLQEKTKGLYVENQLWREMAQSNEAAANSLRSDLQHALAQFGAAEEEVESCGSCDDGGETENERRLCRMCGERQSCVLLLPCRHLCLCSGCGSGSHQLQICPVCNTSMTATLHVNMS